jgi:hypothetical protein
MKQGIEQAYKKYERALQSKTPVLVHAQRHHSRIILFIKMNVQKLHM